MPSPNPLPPLYQQQTSIGDWPEQVEFHPYCAEEESELGYMDDPYHEETYEDLLTPSFFSLERDTLQIVEVTQKHTVINQSCMTWTELKYNCDNFEYACHDLKYKITNIGVHLPDLITLLSGWRRTQPDGEV